MGINKKQSVTVGLLDPLLYSLHQVNINWRIYNIYWRRVALLDQLLWRPILSQCIPHSRGSQWGGEGDRQPSHYKRILAKIHFPQSKCPGWSILYPLSSWTMCWQYFFRSIHQTSAVVWGGGITLSLPRKKFFFYNIVLTTLGCSLT